MPVIREEDFDVTPRDASQIALQKILFQYPDYKSECDLRLSNFIDFTKGTDKENIKCYMFNKIRIDLAAIQKREGFPARMHHTVAFFDLVMFSTKFYTKLFVKRTMDYWDSDGHDMPIKSTGLGGKVSKTSKKCNWTWRKVIMFSIPDEVISNFMGLLPEILPIQEIVSMINVISNSFEWPVYENLVSPGGIHNKIIICNWDKILKTLNEGGY